MKNYAVYPNKAKKITYWKFDFDRVYVNWDEDLKPVLLIVASHTLKKMCVTLTSALDSTSENLDVWAKGRHYVRWCHSKCLSCIGYEFSAILFKI